MGRLLAKLLVGLRVRPEKATLLPEFPSRKAQAVLAFPEVFDGKGTYADGDEHIYGGRRIFEDSCRAGVLSKDPRHA